MHQPDYKDHQNNTTLMPWVFLHGIKDYYDIPWYLENFGKSKASFNLVPSLLQQLESYIQNSANDKFLNIISKDINFITLEEENFLEEYLFLPTLEHMIKPFPRYYELYLKYSAFEKDFTIFSKEELLDLQVLFLLSWCGVYLRENSKLVRKLILKQKDFNHGDKVELIEELKSFLKEIIPYYKRLSDEGTINLTTTPFYHPILPLLLDRNSAKEAKPSVVMPKSNSDFSEFAFKQVEKAVDFFEEKFAKKPVGFWPSEGSVSNKTAALLSSFDIKYMCTDEEILFKSLNSFDKQNLYKPYKLKTQNSSINVFFRDKYLSDLIGFEYSKIGAKEAAKDFVSHLKNIYLNSEENSFVSVILDGENAWEFFPNNAKEFFEELYKALDEESWLETVFFDELEKLDNLEIKELNSISSGSWINGNFDIWIGSSEKNRAWELLDITKKCFDEKKSSLDENTILQIEEEFLIALGSDWFWWYGDDHFTELNHQFDNQFRIHLKNIFELLEVEVPKEIYTPIIKKDKTKGSLIKPKDFIKPTIDGTNSNFFEWLNSGFIDVKKEFSTMDSSNCFVEEILYGKDENGNFYLHFKGDKLKAIKEKLYLKIKFDEFEISLDTGKNKSSLLLEGTQHCDIAFLDGIELKLYDFRLDGFEFSFELIKDEKKLQKFPLYNNLIINLENPVLSNWFV